MAHAVGVVEGPAIGRPARAVAEEDVIVELGQTPALERVQPAARLFHRPVAGTEHETTGAVDLAVGQLHLWIGIHGHRSDFAACKIERMDTRAERDDPPAAVAQCHRPDDVGELPAFQIVACGVPAEDLLPEDVDIIERLLGDVPDRPFADLAFGQVELGDLHPRRSLSAAILTVVTIATTPRIGGRAFRGSTSSPRTGMGKPLRSS
jgi:hypothetical protein